MKNNKPDKIIIPFEYEPHVKTPYYSLELPEYIIDRVALSGILTTVECLEDNDLSKTTIAFWIVTLHGWEVYWRVTAKEFIEKHELKELK